MGYAYLCFAAYFINVYQRYPSRAISTAFYQSSPLCGFKNLFFIDRMPIGLFCFLAFVGMGAMHGALLAFGTFIIAGTLFLITSRNRKGVSFTKVLLITPIAILCLFYGFELFMNLTSYGDRLDDGLGVAVQVYQGGNPVRRIRCTGKL